jgi:glycosyltransferase involved in cell wall biosynthesis
LLSNNRPYYFFVDRINENFPGFSILINKITLIFGYVRTINSLDDIDNNQIVIPMGIIASHLYLKKYKKGKLAFIIDAITLDFFSVIRFYLRRKDFLNKNLTGACLRYIKYYFIERRIIKNFDNIVVVSSHDASYLQKKYKCKNIRVISNGVDIPSTTQKKEKDFSFTLGVLSYWGTGNIRDVSWFILDYLPRLKKLYPEIKLITAGRGADYETIQFFKKNGVQHLGEIDDLWDFFNRIDIFITTVRKECGILNKVLDAMAYQKIVVGFEHNMYAFADLKEGFFTYKDFNELKNAIEIIKNNPDVVNFRINNAFKYILSQHNWTLNYHNFKSLIDSSFNTA